MKAFSWISGAWVLAITLGLTEASWANDGGRAYVVNRASNDVSVVNTTTREVISTIGVGTTPVALALTPDGSKAYVVNSDSNEVSVIDTATLQVITTIPVKLNPKAIVVTPDGQRAYVANQEDDSVSVIDLIIDEVLHNFRPAGRNIVFI
jgi:YVTN family beta-propeller protein